MNKTILSILAILLFSAGCNSKILQPNKPVSNGVSSTSPAPTASPPSPTPTIRQLTDPISNPLIRVTKKPFGIYITKQNSPVQPEKFSGYHTGIDFETTADEQNVDVPIFAACNGKLLQKKSATGYGGVAVQTCKLNGADVTIVYGHVRLSSVTAKVGDQLTAGNKIAVLGTGYSTETSGERRHLHFGIHKGTSINILGYVQKQPQLNDWLDAISEIKISMTHQN